MSALTRAGGVALAAAAALGITAASHAPLTVNRSDDAMLRVAWSARPERVESCRTLGDEELEALPQHMRQRVVCEGATARYRLEVLRDGVPIDSARLRGGGMRHDRQLYVFRELPMPGGPATLEVRLTRMGPAGEAGKAGGKADGKAHSGHEDTDDRPAATGPKARGPAATGRDLREAEEHRRRVEDEIPASLVLRERVTLMPREVVLVTYDREERRLRLVRGTP